MNKKLLKKMVKLEGADVDSKKVLEKISDLLDIKVKKLKKMLKNDESFKIKIDDEKFKVIIKDGNIMDVKVKKKDKWKTTSKVLNKMKKK